MRLRLSRKKGDLCAEVEVEIELQDELRLDLAPSARLLRVTLDALLCDDPEPGKRKSPELSEGIELGISRVNAHYATWHQKHRGSPKNNQKIAARIAEGWSVEELCSAIDGNHKDEWHKQAKQHALEYILRDHAHVEKFLALNSQPSGRPQPNEAGWVKP